MTPTKHRPMEVEVPDALLAPPTPACHYKIRIGAAYATCGGDHAFEQHSAADVRAYANGLGFAVELVHAEARWQTEQAMRGTDGAQHAADRMAEVEKALRSVMELMQPRAAA